jgi:hypothetical protein
VRLYGVLYAERLGLYGLRAPSRQFCRFVRAMAVKRPSSWMRTATLFTLGLLLLAAAPTVRGEEEEADPGHVLQLTEATFDAAVKAEKLVVRAACHLPPSADGQSSVFFLSSAQLISCALTPEPAGGCVHGSLVVRA